MNSSSTTNIDNAENRTRREVLVFPGLGKDDVIDKYYEDYFDDDSSYEKYSVGKEFAVNEEFAIDKDDFYVISKVLSKVLSTAELKGDEIVRHARKMVDIRINDKERRVYKVRFPSHDEIDTLLLPASIEELGKLTKLTHLFRCSDTIMSLPDSIGQLTNLTHLDVSEPYLTFTSHLNDAEYLFELPEEIGERVSLTHLNLWGTKIPSLPPSIGRLENLKDLNLARTENLLELPEEIWDLASLNKLNLEYSNITSLPPSIGQLHNLKHLRLSYTRKLLEVPEEIGDLASLNILNLEKSKITLLPPSIGRLHNLKHLNLSFLDNLLKLPEEIGELASLNILNLRGLKIALLPPSIGQLQNLIDLNLSWTKNLLEVPEEIGDLASLNILNLERSNIALLPPSIGRLQNLIDLDLGWTANLLKLPEEIGELTSLSKLNLDFDGNKDARGETKIFFALACNGARSRIIRTQPNLWPLMLTNATRAFDDFHVDYSTRHTTRETYSVQKPDAIYQLLVDGRDSFIRLLFDRNSNANDF